MLAAAILSALAQTALPTAPPIPPVASERAEQAAPRPPLPGPQARSVAEDRLVGCLDQARTDPGGAMADAGRWLAQTSGSDASYPQQCLGMAYTALLRWAAAEQAFLAARDAALPTDVFRRAQLGTMAANAALAEDRAADALAALEVAAVDARAAGNAGLQAMVAIDRARAQVLQGDQAAAEATLAVARMLDPQSPYAWLLSATLARRLGKLEEAQNFIASATALAPAHLETALEAGVIAMLAGREVDAAQSWSAIVQRAPDSEEAATARGYLAQLAEPAAAEEPAP